MRRLALIALVGLALVACSGETNTLAQLASSPGSIGTGEQRVLVGLIDLPTGQPVATPDVTPTAVLRDDIGSPIAEYEGQFVWVIPDVHGLYAFEVEIPGPATYQLTIDAGELGSDLAPLGFVASEDPQQVSVGETAPLSETRTIADTPIDDLTSDPDPDPSFYEMTVAAAVQDGPSVLIFATPAWCTSQACGPMLDQVKAISGDFADLNYVHVEVYENIQVTDPSELVLVPAITEWGLPTEPWLYVTDASGTVASAFEGAISDAELRAALESVSG